MSKAINEEKLERLQRIRIAANDLDEQSTVNLTANLFQLLGQRSQVAKHLLRCDLEEHAKYSQLTYLYERLNFDIKRLLGLE